MKILIEMFRDDPAEFIGGILAWSGLIAFIFMLSVIGA